MITTPHLPKTFLYNVLRLWSLYLNRCVIALSSEDVGAAGSTATFSLEPIFLELEGGCYVGPLLPLNLAELVSGKRGGGNSSGDSGGNGKGGKGCGGSGRGSGRDVGKGRGAGGGGASSGCGGAGSTVRVRAHYGAYLPALSLRDMENLHTILVGTVLPTV